MQQPIGIYYLCLDLHIKACCLWHTVCYRYYAEGTTRQRWL